MINLKILDNFLNEKDLKFLSKMSLEKVSDNDIKVYHNSIDKLKNVKNSCIDKEKLIDLQNIYHKKAIEILKELNPEKVRLYDYSEFHIVESGSKYKFPIHDDIPAKILSGVIYLEPENNKGTCFYETKDGQGIKEVKWKKNRAVFFSRMERTTWHSFESDGKSNRLVLVYNLMTKDIKSVYKLENKNYLIGLIRSKINPYLHRYFNFII